MFPNQLDNANVLFYTDRNNYGVITYTDGKVAHRVSYLAICKYNDDENYYLFSCDECFNVVADSVWTSVEKCMSIAKQQYSSVNFKKYDS